MLMAAALKPNTQRTYSSAQTRFINFCSKYNLVVMPVTEDTLLLYIAFLFDEGLKGSSIRVYISAVRSLHIYSGFVYPSDMFRVRLALRGAVCQSLPPVRKFPITFSVLSQMLKFVSGRFDAKLLTAVMTLAFFGCMRASEFCVLDGVPFDCNSHLCLRDVILDDNKKVLTVFLSKSKTNTTNSGVKIFIGCSKHSVCAYCSMKSYLASRTGPVDQKSPLFVNFAGDVLKKKYFVSATRLVLSMAGCDPSKYSGHSFRAGAATTAGDRNFEEYELKLLGRWASSAYNIYLRNPHIMTTYASRLANP